MSGGGGGRGCNGCVPAVPNSLAMPALLTAALMALTADWMLVNSWEIRKNLLGVSAKKCNCFLVVDGQNRCLVPRCKSFGVKYNHPNCEVWKAYLA